MRIFVLFLVLPTVSQSMQPRDTPDKQKQVLQKMIEIGNKNIFTRERKKYLVENIIMLHQGDYEHLEAKLSSTPEEDNGRGQLTIVKFVKGSLAGKFQGEADLTTIHSFGGNRMVDGDHITFNQKESERIYAELTQQK